MSDLELRDGSISSENSVDFLDEHVARGVGKNGADASVKGLADTPDCLWLFLVTRGLKKGDL